MAQIDEQIKFLSLLGLQTYDTKIKEYIDNGDLDVSSTLNSKIDGLKAANIAVEWSAQDPASTSTTVLGALNELFTIVGETAEAGELTIWADVSGTPTQVNQINEFGKTYTFKLGNTTVATMNLAKDMVISGGSVVTATAEDVANDSNVVVGQKYIKLIVANSTDILYIPVNELYDDYTFTNSTEISFTEINNNVSASINDGSIAKAKLATALQNEISAAATNVNAKSEGHVQVAVTAASGSTPAQVTITENDIASSTALANEIDRAGDSEAEIAGLVGLTGNEGSRAYSTNVGGASVVADMNLVDGRLDDVETSIGNIATISNSEINNLFA